MTDGEANHVNFRASFIEPMLCAPVKELPEGPDWGYELELDGYRALGLSSLQNLDRAPVFYVRGAPPR